MWVVSLLLAVIAAFALLRYYAEKGTRLYVLIPVAISWSLGFFFFLVLPFDLEYAFCRNCRTLQPDASCRCLGGTSGMGIDMLKSIIPAAYTITMLLGYLMNDMLREYVASGEFSRRGRWCHAVREAGMFYVPALFVGMCFVGYMMYADGVIEGVMNTKYLGRAMVNIIGLFILVGFLGYGLVEVPRQLWNKGDVHGQLRYLQFKVAVQSEELQSARRKLEETLELVHATDAQLRAEAANASNQGVARLQAHMAAMLAICPQTAGAAARPLREVPPGDATLGSQSVEAPPTHKGLVKLHTRLKKAITNEKVARGMYETYVHRGLRQQKVYEAYRTRQPSSAGRLPRHGAGGLAAADENARGAGGGGGGGGGGGAAVMLRPLLYRAASIGCVCMSALIVWCESTILVTGPPIGWQPSPLFWGFRALGSGGGGFGLLLLLYLPMIYCAFCTYFAMFRMKLCDFYALHPHHSDAGSLLFNATYACRLGPPLCFNMLKLLDTSEIFADEAQCSETDAAAAAADDEADVAPVCTYFSQTMFAQMDRLPKFLGAGASNSDSSFSFNDYAPLLIVILCGCTYLNLGSSLLGCCGRCLPCLTLQANSFSFDEDFSDTRIDHGAQILSREGQALAEGTPLGANLQLLSGATSDSEEAARLPAPKGAAAASSRPWNRLQDDNL